MNRKTKIILIILALLILLVLIIYFIVAGGASLNTDNSSAEKLYDCTFRASDSVVVNPEYTVKLFVAEMSETNSFKDENQNLPLRTFSISSLENYKATLPEDIYFIIRKTGGGMLGKIIGADMQFCNAENKSNSVNFIHSSSESVSGVNMYAHGTSLPSTPGFYRVDAIIEVDGQNYLVGRFDSVELTK